MDSTHRTKISNSQIKVLGLVAQYRFVTVEIVSTWINRSKATVYERLAVLEKQGYIQKRYEKRWKLLGRPAVYSLTGKGLRAVRDHKPDYLTATVIRNQYKNKSASAHLVDYSLDVAKLCVQLNKHYDGNYKFFTKSELDYYEVFLRPLSDLYIRTNRTNNEDTPVHYLLEVIEAGTLTWILRKRINAHQEWFDDNNDESWALEDNYPTLLLICDNASTEKRIHRLTDDSLMDFETWTVTRERLASGKKKVWVQYYNEFEDEGVMVKL